ncbi:MAG TPA: AAA family ATPase [Pseudonocardia sp.]|nr:AAA family ATPase [Pseudonocardia sp.]
MEPLAWHDPLPAHPRRILVTGTPGSGKTTVAAALSGRLGIPHTDIDGLYHGPGWVPRPEFADDVAAFVAREEWVTEWQYSVVRPLLLGRADLLVWLDLTRPTVMRQLVPRTLRRRLRRVELWNGNVEPPLRTLLTDRDHILRWAWRTHHKAAARVQQVLASTDAPMVVRLRTRGEVTAWLDGPVAALAPTR